MISELCGWDLRSAAVVAELEPVTLDDVLPLRRWDPQGLFLRG